MSIDLEEYLDNKIGHTDWYGETRYDNKSSENMDKLDETLDEIEMLREHLLSKLKDHLYYNKGNASAENLHKKAKEIMSKHIIKEFATIDFENYWEE